MRPWRARAGAAPALVLACSLAGGLTVGARAERDQKGSVIGSLDGGISPLTLPRHRLAPVAFHLSGGLQTANGLTLPKITKLEIGLSGYGVLSTRGLPACRINRIRNTKTAQAREICRDAIVGRGALEAQVLIPDERPLEIHARLTAFNGRGPDGERRILLHGYTPKPATAIVMPFKLRQRKGQYANLLVANLPRALGPWPRLAHFEMTLSRRYRFRGKERSYLFAKCPIPDRFTAGFLPVARVTYTLGDGRRLETEIVRGCRGR